MVSLVLALAACTSAAPATAPAAPAPSPDGIGRVASEKAARHAGTLFRAGTGGHFCSATVVDDSAHPGKSNLVWTAGHCVHSGFRGGWYRNIIFVLSYNDNGLSASRVDSFPQRNRISYGAWWVDWVQISSQWIATSPGVW